MVKPTNTRSVQLDGPAALQGLKLARLSGREAISRPFEYQLSLYGSDTDGSDGALDTTTILGQSLTVSLIVSGSSPARHFNGIITEFAHVGFGERSHEYRAVLRPSLWLLTRRADCRIFQQKTTPDIFAAVCRQAGSITYRSSLSATYTPWEYRVQYRESDFDFVSRLLEHEGIFYYFEHSAGKHELVLTDDVGKLTAATGYDEVPYFPPSATLAQRSRDHLKSWTIEATFQPAAFASLDYNFETPTALATGASQVASRKDTSTYEIFEYPAGATALTSSGVEALAKLRAERLFSTQSVSHAEGDAAGLVAGRLFTLTSHPRDALNQKYVVVSTVCELTSDSSQTGPAANAVTGPQFSIWLDAVAASAPYRPDRATARPLIQGTQTAVVVGPSGKEVWTDKYGRVKVQFHWDRVGKADDNSSCWVRVAHSWAGKNWGAQYIPRVGQEVVVSFLEGDPDRPLIIGSVYNADQMPPYDLPTNGTQSGMKSRSSLNGTTDNYNELRFEDKQGSEEIYLHAEKDLQVVVENNQTISIGATKKDKGDRTTTVQHDDTLTVGNALSVSVTGAETRTLSKGRKTKVQESDEVTVGMKFTVSADEQIQLVCGAASIVLKADGTVTINGATLALSGTQKASVDSAQTAITGTQVSVSGTKTAVQGSGTLDLSSSGVATLKGSLTKIG